MQQPQDNLPLAVGSIPREARIARALLLLAFVLTSVSAGCGERTVGPSPGAACAAPHVSETANVQDDQPEQPEDQEEPTEQGDATQLTRNGTHRQFSLADPHEVQRLLRDFPDLSHATSLRIEDVGTAPVPDILLEKIAAGAKSLRSFSIGRGTATISDTGMAALSTMSNLEQLELNCRFSPAGFARLARLKKLTTLGTYDQTFGPREYFETVSKLPHIRHLGIYSTGFLLSAD